MGKMPIIRVWQEVDIDQVQPHLLIAGNVSADCGSCKEVGLSLEAEKCPRCGASFKYLGTRISNSAREAKRLRAKRPDLTIIDFNDFKEIQARKKAHGLLGE